MARISLVEPATASTDVQHIFEHRLGGRPANVHKAMAQLPHTLTAFVGFYASAGRSLPARLYEMLYIYVSMLNRCHY